MRALIFAVAAAAAASVPVALDAPTDCDDLYRPFRETLQLPVDSDVDAHFRTAVATQLLKRTIKDNFSWPSWSGGGAAANSSTSPAPSAPAARFRAPAKMLGKRALDAMRRSVEKSLENQGVWSLLWKSVVPMPESIGTKFFSSDYVNTLLDQVIGPVTLDYKSNISMQIDSPMINLGEALCSTYAKSKEAGLTPQVLETYSCATQRLLEHGLRCSAPDVAVTACNSTDAPRDDAAEMAAFKGTCDLVATAKQQADFDPAAAADDGFADWQLIKAISQLYHRAKTELACPLGSPQVLKGWPLVEEISLDYSKINNLHQEQTEAPFTWILKKNGTCDFAIISRGSIYKSDWLIDLEFAPTPLVYREDMFRRDGEPREGEPREGEPVDLGSIARGYGEIASAVAQRVDSRMKAEGCAEPSSMLFAGHSMGAVIGAAEALLFASHYKSMPPPRVVSFGAPPALDEKLAASVEQLTDSHGWKMELDAVSKVPCEDSLPACTGGDSKARVSHKSLPNIRTVYNEELTKILPGMGSRTYGTLSYDLIENKLDLSQISFPAPTLFVQVHTCAFTCWMTATYCSAEAAEKICAECAQQ